MTRAITPFRFRSSYRFTTRPSGSLPKSISSIIGRLVFILAVLQLTTHSATAATIRIRFKLFTRVRQDAGLFFYEESHRCRIPVNEILFADRAEFAVAKETRGAHGAKRPPHMAGIVV